MPSLMMIVMEEHHIRQVVVIIDDISQIHHCLVSFVLWYGEGGGVVGYVDVGCPVRLPERGVQPG